LDRHVAVLAVATALLFWRSPYALRDVTLSLSSGSKSRALVESMGVPGGAYGISKISVSGPDGPMHSRRTVSWSCRRWHRHSSYRCRSRPDRQK
jgi:hypothetical protein